MNEASYRNVKLEDFRIKQLEKSHDKLCSIAKVKSIEPFKS